MRKFAVADEFISVFMKPMQRTARDHRPKRLVISPLGQRDQSFIFSFSTFSSVGRHCFSFFSSHWQPSHCCKLLFLGVYDFFIKKTLEVLCPEKTPKTKIPGPTQKRPSGSTAGCRGWCLLLHPSPRFLIEHSPVPLTKIHCTGRCTGDALQLVRQGAVQRMFFLGSNSWN